jgi:quaternary ammonium compound-resistance protein SugE
MAWAMLIVAGILEIGWAIGLKYTNGFTRPIATVLTIIAMVASMTLLGLAVQKIPVGTGYAIWTGIGAVGTALLGIVLFHEPVTPTRIVFLLMIVAGIVGLKFSAGAAVGEAP